MVATEQFGPDYKLGHNRLDFETQFKKGRFLGVRLSLFFDPDKQEGPHTCRQLNVKNREFPSMCKDVETAWKVERSKLASGTAKDSGVRAQLDDLKKEQKTSSMAQARVKAQSAIAKRKLKRAVSVKSDP